MGTRAAVAAVLTAGMIWAGCDAGGGGGVLPPVGDADVTLDGAGDVTTPDADAGPQPDGVSDPDGDAGLDPDGDAGEEPPVESCEAPLDGPGDGTCAVEPGGEALLLEGDLILPDRLLEAGRVLVVDGLVACVGCDCGSRPAAEGATRVTCPEGVISPGLINAHDHITFTQMRPTPHGDERYDHRHEWRKGKNGKTKLPATQNSHALGDAWGEMRQAMAGTTSLFGSGGEDGFLRNLDRGNLLEGLGGAPADYSTFPLGDSGGTMVSDGCTAYDYDDPDQAAQEPAYVPHLAEGVVDAARNEFVCVSGLHDDGVDLVNPNAGLIHGIGLTATDVALLAGEGAGLVWSPRSNTDLYGFTADAPLYDRLGALVALGSDWTASGSVHMLRELACAEQWNGYWGHWFSDAELVAMATSSAAEMLGFGDTLGSLVDHKVADIAIWDASEHPGYRAVLDAGTEDVVLVLRGGVPLYGDDETVAALTEAGDCDALDVCGRDKRLCTPRELGTSTSDLESELGSDTYDLFFCGEPDDEPSCTPFRPDEFDGQATADDPDGDGIPDVDDNCPDVFNAVRPMDVFEQPDTDGDGEGDACDPCPLDADTTACSSVDPTDVDGDGVGNATDNCPGVANEDQADADDDGTGDACDACPEFWNPAGGPCPTTIYAVKKGDTPTGDGALVQSVLVTAVDEFGFWVGVEPASEGWEGPEFSGVYVYAPDAVAPPVGARVDVKGTVDSFFGQLEIVAGQVEVLDPEAGAPSPVSIDPASAGPGGDAVEAWEGVLVRVEDVEVLDVSPTGGEGETVENEFVITGGLSVDDGIHALEPMPSEGQVFAAITGVVAWSWGRNKLYPRGPEDILWSDPGLHAFGPSSAVLYAGEAQTSQPALEVSLTGPALDDTFVAVTSADEDVVTVVDGGVTIPEGASSAPLLLEYVSAGGPVVLTASLDGVSLEAEVTALAAGAAPQVVDLVPQATSGPIGAEVELIVTVDLPAPAGGWPVDVTAEGAPVELPEAILVPAGETSVTVPVTLGDTPGEVILAAGEDVQVTLTITELATVGLRIAEVLYDVDGSDDGKEWVRLFNGTPEALDLDGWYLGWGGVDWTYGVLDLSGTIPAWSCVVVGGPSSDEDNGAPTFDLAEDFAPDIQNASGQGTADGIALFDVPADAVGGGSVPLDAVVYGGVNDSGLVGADGQAVSPPHVDDAPSGASIRRVGVDTWEVAEIPTPDECVLLQ
ncbi:MAG: amidohydrolase family protein [Myxococcota bacterium]